MIGFVLGAVSGGAQFWMLTIFTKTVTGGAFNKTGVVLGVIQFFLPLVVLLGCAFLFPNGILWAGSGMAAALLSCAIVKFALNIHK